MDDIAQATPQELRRLFSPGSTEKEPTNKWFITQLHLYGIPFKKSARKPELKEALREAFHAGKCNRPAPLIAAVRDSLREQYEAALKLIEDKKFAEIEGGHGEEANSDPPRFVAKYFLDSKGQPDRTKTPIPLSFRVWNHEEELDEVIASVPGLAILKTWSTCIALVGWENTMQSGIEHEFARLEEFFKKKEQIHSAQANVDLAFFLKRYLGLDTNGNLIKADAKPSTAVVLTSFRLQNQKLPDKIVSNTPGLVVKEYGASTVIGWDVKQVEAEIAQLKEEHRQEKLKEEAEIRAEKERERLEKKERHDRRYKGHHDLLAQQRQRPSPFGLQHLPGSNIIEHHSGKEEWDMYNDPVYDDDVMKLHIFPAESRHGVKASFSFGMIEGTMLLAMSRRAVVLLREEQPKHSDYSEPEDDGDDDEVPAPSRSALVGEKRAVGEVADPWGVLAARAKRQKMEAAAPEKAAPSNRVYFEFVCNEVNGYPDVDDDNEFVGYFDFDETGLTAKGGFSYPSWSATCKDQPISLTKISDKPECKREPMPWYMFDGRSWGRWGSRW